jgi:hypothetical protein
MKIQTDSGTINIPMHVDEIKYSEFLNFKMYEEEFFNAPAEEKPAALVDLVKNIYEVDVTDLPFGSPEEDYSEYFINLGDDLTVMRLYHHYINLINTFNPDIKNTYEIKYKGQKFYLDAMGIMKSLEGAAYTAGEVITVCEYQRVLSKKTDSIDDSAAMSMKLGLIEMAVLLRKKGEKLPSRQSERETFISNRAKFFSELSMDKVLAVRFFLLDILKAYVRTTDISSSGKDESDKWTNTNEKPEPSPEKNLEPSGRQ